MPGATWRVSYQARASQGGKRVQVIAQAIVQQGTGEDWSNVRLAVSTADGLRAPLADAFAKRFDLPLTQGLVAIADWHNLAAAFQRAFTLKLLQHTLQLDPVRALDPEGLGDVALGGQAGIVGDPVEDFGF